MKKIVWMACGMALMCAPLSASANVRYDDPQEKVQKKEVPNPEKAAQRRTDEMDKALNLTEYNPQIQISAESETKRSIFREKDKTKRSKKESAQHSKSRNKSFVMTSVSAL